MIHDQIPERTGRIKGGMREEDDPDKRFILGPQSTDEVEVGGQEKTSFRSRFASKTAVGSLPKHFFSRFLHVPNTLSSLQQRFLPPLGEDVGIGLGRDRDKR